MFQELEGLLSNFIISLRIVKIVVSLCYKNLELYVLILSTWSLKCFSIMQIFGWTILFTFDKTLCSSFDTLWPKLWGMDRQLAKQNIVKKGVSKYDYNLGILHTSCKIATSIIK